MTTSFPEFRANVKFLEYLAKIHGSPELQEALKRKDFSDLNTAPGLSEKERDFFKMIDWNDFEIMPDPDLKPITTEAGSVGCERVVTRDAVQSRCWKV